jgi:hypothetical protein
VSLGTDLYGSEKFRPHRVSKPRPFSLASRYTDYATQAGGIGKYELQIECQCRNVMLVREGSYGIILKWVVILKIWKFCNVKPMIGVVHNKP